MYKLRETSRDISSLGFSNNFISDIHIYIKNSNVILTPKTSYIRLPFSYGADKILNYSEYDYKEWHKKILNGFYNKEYLPRVMLCWEENST